MALFPKIQSPCPYPGDLDDIVTAGRCSLCDKIVHDLTTMTDAGRRRLVESHDGDLCVRYTVLRPALAAMALGLSATAAMASGQPSPASMQDGAVDAKQKPVTADQHGRDEWHEIMVGGLNPKSDSEANRKTSRKVRWRREMPAPAKAR